MRLQTASWNNTVIQIFISCAILFPLDITSECTETHIGVMLFIQENYLDIHDNALFDTIRLN